MTNAMNTIRLFCAGCLTALVGCADRSSPPLDPRAADPAAPLVFLAHPTTPPRCWTNEVGDVVGEDIDLARLIAARLGRAMTVEAVPFEDILPRLKAGTADFAIATITITEARRVDVDFSEPYQISGNCFLYRVDGPRPRMSQAASFRIGAETGTTGDIYLCNHEADPVRFAHADEAVAALARGDIDAVFFDAVPLGNWAAQSGGRLVVSPLETREGYGVAVDKRRPDVLKAANEVIAGLNEADGKGASK